MMSLIFVVTPRGDAVTDLELVRALLERRGLTFTLEQRNGRQHLIVDPPEFSAPQRFELLDSYAACLVFDASGDLLAVGAVI